MKKIAIILLLISLYSPQIVQLLRYSNCALQASFNVDESLCDCLKKSTTTYHATDGFVNSEIKTPTTQVNWNYTSDNNFLIKIKPIITANNKQGFYYNYVLPNAPSALIFRPPC